MSPNRNMMACLPKGRIGKVSNAANGLQTKYFKYIAKILLFQTPTKWSSKTVQMLASYK